VRRPVGACQSLQHSCVSVCLIYRTNADHRAAFDACGTSREIDDLHIPSAKTETLLCDSMQQAATAAWQKRTYFCRDLSTWTHESEYGGLELSKTRHPKLVKCEGGALNKAAHTCTLRTLLVGIDCRGTIQTSTHLNQHSVASSCSVCNSRSASSTFCEDN
jgi:hypothetical protein